MVRTCEQENTPAGEPCETGRTGEGSRSGVRGFQNFEPRTANFVSCLLRAAHLVSLVGSVSV